MSTRRPANLRNVLSIAAIVVSLLSIIAALSLVFVTSTLQQMTSDIAASVESVRTIEEAEVNLLLHVRADPGERAAFEGELRARLDDAAAFVQTPQEARSLGDVRVEVERYLEIANRADTPESERRDFESRAIAALERLVDLNVAHTRAAHDRAKQWDRIGTIAGAVLGISIVVISAALVLWLRRRVIRPLFKLADTVKRFGEGQRAIRADEDGPIELREMTRRFNEMADAIAAQRQAQTAFLGGVAHDLRNPLGALKLSLEMIRPGEPLPPEPQLRRMLAIIGRQIAHLERMVGDFLDMAKIEAGELALKLEMHDITAIVRNSVELFDAAARQRFELALPDGPITVECDAVRVGQVVTNLVSNALKYSPPQAPVAITVAGKGDQVTIEVADRGVGIPRDDHRRIFEPFQRGAAAKTDVPGAGLGLFNVRRIVQAHGGRIEVESVPGQGSTFRITLWRHALPQQASDERPHAFTP